MPLESHRASYGYPNQFELQPPRPNHGEAVYIINTRCCISSMQSIVYHQAAGKYTLARDEIQPEGLMIYAARCASIICQACGLDKKTPKASAFGVFLEVTAGFEPADNGVADRGLTTWLRHHILFCHIIISKEILFVKAFLVLFFKKVSFRPSFCYYQPKLLYIILKFAFFCDIIYLLNFLRGFYES